jgi:hybrid cluster-associated redox disulfide protein
MTKDATANVAITPETRIGDALTQYPQTLKVFLSHGLMCVGCAVARFENIRQGADAHGIDLEALMKDLNQVAQQAPDKAAN